MPQVFTPEFNVVTLADAIESTKCTSKKAIQAYYRNLNIEAEYCGRFKCFHLKHRKVVKEW